MTERRGREFLEVGKANLQNSWQDWESSNQASILDLEAHNHC